LGQNNFIFVCSGCDLFHPDVPDEWILKVIGKTTIDWRDNTYLWHTKNPGRASDFLFQQNSILCATIESTIPWPGISKAPQPFDRIDALKNWKGRKMITCEPLLRHDLKEFSQMIISARPMQVNIGLDSGHNNLPEPTEKETRLLIQLLKEAGIKVFLKKNIRRLIPDYAELSDLADCFY
jgi:protein gp37